MAASVGRGWAGTDAVSSSPYTFFVSNRGTDAGTGTRDNPFATIEKARDAIRELNKNRAITNGGVTVWIQGGSYNISKTLAFSKQDSGKPDGTIVYASLPGEPVRLFGGVSLNRDWFKPVTNSNVLNQVISPEARGSLLQCNLGDYGITNYGAISRRGFGCSQWPGAPAPACLYYGEKRLMLARWPNPTDHFPVLLNHYDQNRRGAVARKSIVEPGPAMNSPEGKSNGGVFEYSIDRPSLWLKAEDLWLDGVFSWSWEWSYNKVSRIDPNTKQIHLKYGEYSTLKDVYSGNWFFAENLLEEIDIPGEYYINRNAGILYLLPPADFGKSNSIYLSALAGPMVEFKEVSDLKMRGIVLDTGRSRGIELSHCRRVQLDQCEITRFALGGMILNGEDCSLANSHIHDVGGGGVMVSGGNLKTLVPAQNVVSNCIIHDWGWYNRVYTAGVDVQGVGQLVTHCQIYHSPHAGVFLSGNDHILEYNEIQDVCREFIDMGAVYVNVGTSPFQRGWVIRKNYFHDIANADSSPINCEGIYLDHGTSGGLIEDNYFNRIGIIRKNMPAANAIWLSGLQGIVRHNVFVNCAEVLMVGCKPKPDKYLEQRNADYHWPNYFAGFDLTNAPHLLKYPELRAIIPGGKLAECDMLNDFYSNIIIVSPGSDTNTKPINWRGYDSRNSPVIPLRQSDNIIVEKDAHWNGEFQPLRVK